MTRKARKRYRKVIRRIAKEEGVSNGPRAKYKIGPNATQSKCISYALQYVVGGDSDSPHYRYDRYRDALDECFDDLPFDPKVQRALHLDLGAGPGLFTWVFWDWTRRQAKPGGGRRWKPGSGQSLELYGYDHADAMAGLAQRAWKEFGLSADYRCVTSAEDLYSQVLPGYPPANVLITVGHALIQTGNRGLQVFGRLAETVARLDPNGRARLVAVDAHSGSRPAEFASAWKKLVSAMRHSRVKVVWKGDRSERVARVRVVSDPGSRP